MTQLIPNGDVWLWQMKNNKMLTIKQKLIAKIFNNPIGRKYLGVPKGKRIYKITQSSVHYYTGELSKRNGLPVICTGNCSPNGKFVFNQIMKLAKVVSVFAFLPFIRGLEMSAPLFVLADTGFQSPTAYENDTGITNPANVYSSDNNYAFFPQDTTAYASYKTFGISIASGATIDGIEVTIEGHTSAGAESDIFIYLSWNGGTSWTPDGDPYTSTRGYRFSGSTEVTPTIGSPTYTWERTWSDTEFSDANFRYKLSARANRTIAIDHIQVKVYYTEALSATGNFFQLF